MNTCPCCGKPMNVYEQQSLNPARPAYQLAECHTPGCSLFMVTLTLGAHQLLTPRQIEGYAKVNRKHQAKATA